MEQVRPITVLCLASYFKGTRFIEACKRAGAHVILVTKEKLAHEPWPMDLIDERFLMPDLHKQPDITNAISYLARTRSIDRIVALDEYDTQTAAALREHLRVPGMGATTGRHFRDKLAMRVKAEEAGIAVPPFVHVLNHDAVRAYLDRVPPPWVLKPRAEASAMGIKKIDAPEKLWHALDVLGDRQSFFLLEQYLPGEVFHIDSVVWDGEVVFAAANGYTQPPLNVYQGGGVFATRTLPREEEATEALLAMNQQLLHAFGLVRGVAHAEFIGSGGRFYFLEVAARVGGAYIDRLVGAATGVNLWEEWARVEITKAQEKPYLLPASRHDYAGLLVCLAHQEYPDLSGYEAPEVVWRLHKKHHAGLIVAAPEADRMEALLAHYTTRFADDFLATQPPLEQAPD